MLDRRLLVILGGAALIRLVLLLLVLPHTDRAFAPDSQTYVLVAKDWPTDLWSPSAANVYWTLLRTPGYPALLAAVWLSPQATIVVQIALSLALVVVVYLFTAGRYGYVAAMVASSVVAFEPASLLHDFLILTEILFTSLLTTAVLLWVRGFDHGWRSMALSGVALGLATLVRPVSLLLIIPLAVFTVLHPSQRRAVVPLLTLGLVFMIPTGIWVARNFVVTGHPIFSTVGATDIAHYRAPSALAIDDHISLAEADTIITAQITATDAVARADQEQSIGLRTLAAHPKGALVETVTGAARLLVGPGLTEWDHTFNLPLGNPVIHLVDYAVAGFLIVATVAGGALALRQRRWELLGLVVVIVYMVVVSSGAESYSRFRVPFVPMMAILIGFAAAGVKPLGAAKIR